MVRASTGTRRRTRRRLKKRGRNKLSIERMAKAFKVQDKVVIRISPSSQRGLPHPKFTGLEGVVVGSRGSSYLVDIMKGNKRKTVIVSPEHIMLVEKQE